MAENAKTTSLPENDVGQRSSRHAPPFHQSSMVRSGSPVRVRQRAWPQRRGRRRGSGTSAWQSIMRPRQHFGRRGDPELSLTGLGRSSDYSPGHRSSRSAQWAEMRLAPQRRTRLRPAKTPRRDTASPVQMLHTRPRPTSRSPTRRRASQCPPRTARNPAPPPSTASERVGLESPGSLWMSPGLPQR